MLGNYFATAWRNLLRHKLYSAINIGGLALGLACVIFVLLFIRDELSYDSWIPSTQNLYRIEKIYYSPGREPLELAVLPFPMPAALQDGIPEVAAMTRLNFTSMTLFAGDRQFRQQVGEVDPNFFQVIHLPLVKGDPTTIFQDPESVVLSESAARRFFGTTDAVGKLLRATANCATADMDCATRLVPLKVTGVMRDIPHNSHLEGEVFLPNTSIVDRIGQPIKQAWTANPGFGYVALAPGARPETVLAKSAPLFDRLIPVEADRRAGSQRYAIHLTPFADVHLDSSRWRFNQRPAGSRVTLYGVGIVGILILLVACFNFTNLATARASLRAREIAMRKTLGGRRGQLVFQFLAEAVLTAMLSLTVALALAEILEPAFGRLLQHPVAIRYDLTWMSLMALIALVAGLLSGIYPALVLSGFRPSAILRSGHAGRAGSGRLQTILVVLQFAVSIGLGIAVAVVFGQISFARNVDLGFRKDNLLVVAGNGAVMLDGRGSFVQQLRSHPTIMDVAVTDAVPFGSYSLALPSAQVPGRPDPVALNQLVIGADMPRLLGMRLLAGRLLSDERAQDRFNARGGSANGANEGRNILIDQMAASNFGFTPQQAVGKTILVGKSHVQIVGVFANTMFDGAREPAKATMYVYDPEFPASVVVRLRPDAVPQALSFIDQAWRDFAPTRAINRYFVNDNFARLYQADERQGELFGVFVVIAIFVSCLGLLGLAAFAVGRRTKEIGLRKVFGARVRDVTLLLLWQFSIPVLLANLIAWPVAWYYLQTWLEGFAYRITLNPLYFFAAGLAALLIAWITVFTHAWRVARANPIHTLRYE
ncbi:MAG TPA: ABC transporter permease [Rhizomicrobium sp.]|nr:ABC transporter permease [Rhizomicrobium sp.]